MQILRCLKIIYCRNFPEKNQEKSFVYKLLFFEGLYKLKNYIFEYILEYEPFKNSNKKIYSLCIRFLNEF